MTAREQTMTFEGFRRFVSDILGIAEEALTPRTHLVHDLAVDSLKLVELMVQLEKVLDKKIPSDVAWEILTMGDIYQYYLRHAEKKDDR